MQPRHLVRTGLTCVNGTTAVALVVAAAARTRLRPAPDGILIAEGYRLPVPRQRCFTMGCVIFTRGRAAGLLRDDHADLLGHESRHVWQYALLGPLFWPAYWLACGYSWAVSGRYGARNFFERHAGLAAGGYRDVPLRPWAARLARRRPEPSKRRERHQAGEARAIRAAAAASSPTRRPDGSPSPR